MFKTQLVSLIKRGPVSPGVPLEVLTLMINVDKWSIYAVDDDTESKRKEMKFFVKASFKVSARLEEFIFPLVRLDEAPSLSKSTEKLHIC